MKPVIYNNKNSWLKRMEEFFYPDVLERRNIFDKSVAGGRRKSDDHEQRRSKFQILFQILIASGIVFAIVGFIYAVHFYSTTLQRIEQNPLVYNLTENNVLSEVKFVKEEACDVSSPKCWHNPGFQSEGWNKILLPRARIDSVDGYKDFVDKGWAIYRTQITLPKGFNKIKDEVAFSSMYINHPTYIVYMNGVRAYSGNELRGNFPVIPIPKALIQSGEQLTVTIAGSLKAGFSGIYHRGSMFVGPKEALDGLTITKERNSFSYFLIFLFSKGSIFVVFCMFFFLSTNKKGLTYFLLFALFTALSPLYEGGFLRQYLVVDTIIFLYFSGSIIAYVSLLGFYGEFFNSNRLKRLAAKSIWVLLPLFTLMWVDSVWGSKSFDVREFFLLIRSIIFCVILLGVVAGVLRMRFLKRYNSQGHMYKNALTFTVVSMLYFTLLTIYISAFEYKGFDLIAVLDMLFFYLMAFLTAREFGSNEKRINSFKEIKQEKERMEQELQDAAMIANAFVPDEPPSWDNISISSYHKPLTETSGDWFAFKEDNVHHFKHFIMCDVTGHGVQAALIVSSCKTVLSMLEDSLDTFGPKDFIPTYVENLNRVLYLQGEGKHTTTFLGLTFDQKNHKVYFYSAAHPAPLIISEGSEKKKTKLLLSRNNPIGFEESIKPELQQADFELNDNLLVYSDGIELFSNKRLLRYVINNIDSRKTSKHLFASSYVDLVKEFELEQKGYSIQDDTTLICFDRVA